MKVSGNNSVELIRVEANKSTPIYRQIMESIEGAIADGALRQGDLIPSVNAVAKQFSIARGSIFKAYNELRTAGVVDSIPGKGYFVINTRAQKKKNIFLLMSTYNPYREVLYNAFMATLKNKASVDIYFHHHNIEVFDTLVRNHAAHYNTFVIMPVRHKKSVGILRQLDQRQLYVLDTGLSQFGTLYPGVFQNYRQDIYVFLQSIVAKLAAYKRILLLFSSNMRNYEVIDGFEAFFAEHARFEAAVIRETGDFVPEQGDLCVVMDDKDLVGLIQYSKNKGWVLGEDIGIISYHETPLKSIISDGISTISPDFEQMGSSMANLILQNNRTLIENPFRLIDRGSF